MDVFDRRGNKTCDYVLLRSEQVGVLSPLVAPGLTTPPARGNCSNDFCQV